MKKSSFLALAVGLMAMAFTSCESSHITSREPANLAKFTDSGVAKAWAARPAVRFPATIAAVRIQNCSTYQNNSGFSVLPVIDDISNEESREIARQLSGVQTIAPLSSLLFTDNKASDLAIRSAAAKLHANVVLVYTLNTSTNTSDFIEPLTVLTLGLLPNRTYRVNAVVSAILMDTQTGFVYGTLEEKDSRTGLTMAWGSEDATTGAMRKAEKSAIKKLLKEFPAFWNNIYRLHK